MEWYALNVLELVRTCSFMRRMSGETNLHSCLGLAMKGSVTPQHIHGVTLKSYTIVVEVYIELKEKRTLSTYTTCYIYSIERRVLHHVR